MMSVTSMSRNAQTAGRDPVDAFVGDDRVALDASRARLTAGSEWVIPSYPVVTITIQTGPAPSETAR